MSHQDLVATKYKERNNSSLVFRKPEHFTDTNRLQVQLHVGHGSRWLSKFAKLVIAKSQAMSIRARIRLPGTANNKASKQRI